MRALKQRCDALLRVREWHILTELYQKPKAQTTKPLPKRKIFPFLDLPAEIRNTIYDYVLYEPSGINFVGTYRKMRRVAARISAEYLLNAGGRIYSPMSQQAIDNANGDHIPLVPSLLAVNKQIYNEGIDILYGNQLIFADSLALYSFLINLGPVRAQHLRKIRILGWHYTRAMKVYNNACFTALAWATNLTSLDIHAPVGGYRAPCDGAIQFYRDAFPWLEAVGAAKGKPDAALDVLTFGGDWLSDYWGCRSSDASVSEYEEKVERFKTEVAKCLGAHRDRILAVPKKSVKKAKKVQS